MSQYLIFSVLLFTSLFLTSATPTPSQSPTPSVAAVTLPPSPPTTPTTILTPTSSPAPTANITLNTSAAASTLIPTPSSAPTPTITATTATHTPTPSPAHTPTLTLNTSSTKTPVPASSPAHIPLAISNITTTTIITASRRSPHDHRQQLKNIIDALVGAGDFNIWANVLSVAEPSALPLSATLFIPADDSRSPITTTITIDPYIFPYHIVPQRLSFSELCQFKLYSCLPTLLAAKSILITNNSISN